MGNRKVFEVEAYFKTNMVIEDGEDINELVRRFLHEHPERLKIDKKYICDAERLEKWEVKKRKP